MVVSMGLRWDGKWAARKWAARKWVVAGGQVAAGVVRELHQWVVLP